MLKLMAESGSRVAFISFIMMFSIGTLLLETKRSWYKLIVLLLSGFLFAFMIQFILSSEILMNRLLKSAEVGDLAGRNIIWEKLMPLIKENPFFGVGRTGYAEYTQKVFLEAKSPHNVIIEVLCYTGIIGLIFYMLFIIRSLIFSYKAYNIKHIILPILLFIPILGYLLSGQLLTNKIGWLIVSFSIGMGIVKPLNFNEKSSI